jgi:hypothetical protein
MHAKRLKWKMGAVLTVAIGFAIAVMYYFAKPTENSAEPIGSSNASAKQEEPARNNSPVLPPMIQPARSSPMPPVQDDMTTLVGDYIAFVRTRDFGSARRLLPKIKGSPEGRELCISRYRDWLSKGDLLVDRIRVCGYLMLAMSDLEVMAARNEALSGWRSEEPEEQRLRKWKSIDALGIDEPAHLALSPFAEDVITAEAFSFWLSTILQTRFDEGRREFLNSVLTHDKELLDDPFLSLCVDRLAVRFLLRPGTLTSEHEALVRGSMQRLSESGVGRRLAYQIKVVLAGPPTGLVDLVTRIQEAEGRQEAVKLLLELLKEDYYLKSDYPLVLSALIARFGAGGAARIFADTLHGVPHFDDADYVCRLASLLGGMSSAEDVSEDLARLGGDLIAKSIAEANVRRFIGGVSAERRTDVLAYLPDGGRELIRRLRRYDLSRAKDERQPYDLLARLILIFEASIPLHDKLEEVRDEMALSGTMPVNGVMLVVERLAMTDVQSILALSQEVSKLIRNLLGSMSPIDTVEKLRMNDLHALTQISRDLGLLKDLIGSLSVDAAIVLKLKTVLREYRSQLQKQGLLEQSEKQFLDEAEAALEKLGS